MHIRELQKHNFMQIETIMDPLKENENDGGYSWEGKYKRSWDVFESEESVSLQRLVASVQNQMRRFGALSCRCPAD